VPTPTPPPETFGNGSFEVGVDIAPGRYVSAGPQEFYPICTFVRLKDAGGNASDLNQVIEQQLSQGQAIVNIAPTDGGFFSIGCQTWTRRDTEE